MRHMEEPIFEFIVGGRAFHAPEMRFLALQRAWPHWHKLRQASLAVAAASARVAADQDNRTVPGYEPQASQDDHDEVLGSLIEQAGHAVEIVAAACSMNAEPEQRPSAQELRCLLWPVEMSSLVVAVSNCVTTSFARAPSAGEAMAAGSTGTSAPSLPNSPPGESAGATRAA